MKKIIALGMAVLMGAALLAGCGGKYTVDKVVMTYVTSPLNVPSVIEKEQGNFREAFGQLGLDFDYATIDSGADQTAALASGDIQILNAVGGSSVILAAAGGLDIRIISMYSKAPGAFAMYSKDESINSPEDLEGLTIAGPKGTNLHELLVAYLDTAGMTIDSVDFVSMDIPSAVAALEGGSIDVALAGGAAAYNLEKSGAHKITDGEGLIAATIVTATSSEFAEKNPQIIETFKKTQEEILQYIEANTDEALKTTADVLGLDEQAVKDMYELYDFSPEITDTDIELLASTEDFLYESGMIENEVDVAELILE